MIRPVGALWLALVILAGCQTSEQGGAQLSSSEWTADRVVRLLNPPPPKIEVEVVEEEPPPLPRRRPLQLAKLAPAAQALAIDGLVGLDFDATKKLLGAPALDEVQPPARVWAYNGRGCVLSIFFYPNLEGSSYRALTYEVKGSEDTDELTQRCFTELVQDHGGT